MQCVILAGGKGTRLGAVTEKIPKSMVMVKGRPFLEYQIELLRQSGVDEIILCVGYLYPRIEDYFQKGEKFGVKLTYSYEREKLLGTAGALRQASGLLKDAFLVMYGDSYLEIDYRKVYRHFLRIDYPVLMTVYLNEDRWDRSNVAFAAGRVIRYDKKRPAADMRYIDYGLSVFKRSIVEKMPVAVPDDLSRLYMQLAWEGRLGGYEVFRRFYEVGSKQGIKDFEEYIKMRFFVKSGSVKKSNKITKFTKKIRKK